MVLALFGWDHPVLNDAGALFRPIRNVRQIEHLLEPSLDRAGDIDCSPFRAHHILNRLWSSLAGTTSLGAQPRIGFDGEPIGSVSAVRYGTEFGFLGFCFVKPAYRGQGYGLRLWRATMDRLGSRNVGLDGVLASRTPIASPGSSLPTAIFAMLGSAEEASRRASSIFLSSPSMRSCATTRPCSPYRAPRS